MLQSIVTNYKVSTSTSKHQVHILWGANIARFAHAVQDLLGRGALWSPRPLLGYAFGGIRDAGFGLYGRCNFLKAILEDRWAGKPLLMLFIFPCFDDLPCLKLALISCTMLSVPEPTATDSS